MNFWKSSETKKKNVSMSNSIESQQTAILRDAKTYFYLEIVYSSPLLRPSNETIPASSKNVRIKVHEK